MNVHFLELFYHVASSGGISAAVRQMPYGIQQPAVSSQMKNLEREIGVRLFERVPFRLTAAGEKLYAHVAPFFAQMAAVVKAVRAEEEPLALNVAAAELVLRDHLPFALSEVKKRFPRLRVSLRSLGYQAEAEAWLRRGQIDVAFVPLRARAPAGLKQLPLAHLPLVLQVHPRSPYKSASSLLAHKKLSLPLIGLPEDSTISTVFQKALQRHGVQWPQTVEAGSLDLVTRYVVNGDGIGVSVEMNPGKRTRGVRTLPLDESVRITMGALWRGQPSPPARDLVDLVQAHARRTWPAHAG